jgi:ABC-type lipoprotein release transport system permease subunit
MIRRMVVREGLTMTVAGTILGVVGAQLSAKLLTRFIYDTRPSDPSTIALVIGAVLGVALVACAVPGWRASAEDPTTALRAE